MKKQHNVVLRVVKRSGFRVDYQLVLNEHTLVGKVIRTMSKGKEVWWTVHKAERLPYFDPQWLSRRNGRIVNLTGHPSMKLAVAYMAEHPDTKPIVREEKMPVINLNRRAA